MAATRWKLTIEYDGGAYAGWQRQDNVMTVQQGVEDVVFVNMRFAVADVRREADGRTYHALIRFRAVTEPA